MAVMGVFVEPAVHVGMAHRLSALEGARGNNSSPTLRTGWGRQILEAGVALSLSGALPQ